MDKGVRSDPFDFTRTRVAKGILRKAIRTLVSKGAASDTYVVFSKLFMLDKAHSSFNMPQHFLPKYDFRYNRKVLLLDAHLKEAWKRHEYKKIAKNFMRESALNDLGHLLRHLFGSVVYAND
ncbi:hypothetical protein Tco_1232844 [Tanacetum coccineum]